MQEKIRTTKAAVDAAVEVNKRAAAEKDKADFYRIVLSEEDKKEIKELQELLSHFRNPEPLNKVIWKTYYEKPYTDLIGHGGRDDTQVLASKSSLGDSNVQPSLWTT